MPRMLPNCRLAELQQQSLCVFTHHLRESLSRRPLTDIEVGSIERYLKTALPTKKRELVLKALAPCMCCRKEQGRCQARSKRGTRTLEGRPSSHHCEDPVYFCNRCRLASTFGETDLCLFYNKDTSTTMAMWDLRSYTKVKFKLPPSYGDECFDYSDPASLAAFTHNLLNYVCTMTNVVHLEINVCPPKLLALVSRSCPALETLILKQIMDCEPNLVGLCGYRPRKLSKADAVCGNQKSSFAVCTRLKHIKLGEPRASLQCLALLLNVFTDLLTLRLKQSISLLDVLTHIYGLDSSRYDSISRKYKITNVNEGYPPSGDQMSLLVQVCPDLARICMTLGGSFRYDKNTLAELLPLKHLTFLKLFMVNMESLLWFLESSSCSLEHLFVLNSLQMRLCRPTTIRRSNLQRLADLCPNLVTLDLCSNNITLVRDSDHYDPNRLGFKNLRSLQLQLAEGTSLELQDIQFFLSSPSLKYVAFHNMLPLSDRDCELMLRLPLFREVLAFFHGGLISGATNLDKFLEACPLLEQTDAHLVSKADTEHLNNRITQNNWALNRGHLLPPTIGHIDELPREMMKCAGSL